MSFQALGLAEPISRALTELRYVAPTPIQTAAIPPAMTGRDLIGIAQTGTGKTAAFALPVLHRLAETRVKPEAKATRVLILTPTRELAVQIVESFTAYGRHMRLKVRLAFGGVPIGRQKRELAEGTDVLVATPGRLRDLQRCNAITLDGVAYLILDEADRMLDLGFIRDIEAIVAALPRRRQTLFFSATMPPEIERLATRMLNDPVKVAVTPVASTAERVAQRVSFVERAGKPAMLVDLLGEEPVERALVFTRTKHGADRVERGLCKAGIDAAAIHGNKSQPQRQRVLDGFRRGQVRVLVATDIAARGIDVEGVSHVFNFDLPEVPETYVHRIGRTARAGREGVAISLVSDDERPLLCAIERLIKIDLGGGYSDLPPKRPEGRREAARPGSRGKGRAGEGKSGQGRSGQGKPGQNAGQNRQAHGKPDAGQPGKPSAKRNRRKRRTARPDYVAPHRGDDLAAVAFLGAARRRQRDPATVET